MISRFLKLDIQSFFCWFVAVHENLAERSN